MSPDKKKIVPLEIKPIGTLESCFQEKFGTPRQPRLVPGALSKLRVNPQFAPAHSLSGLAEFSHVWLLSWMHLNTNKTFHPKIHPPRLKGGKIGVFASRSPHRPNPIGLSLAKLERVEGDTLYLSGLDLINGTPILDIKPYLPFCDAAEGALSGWLPANSFPELKVVFSPAALADIARIEAAEKPGIRALIADTLRHDPRNMRDKTQMVEGTDMGFFLANHDVHFSVTGATATVLRVETGLKFEKKFRRTGPAAKA
ncbi:MAG: tRNA (N6-threonylcarbamoyladenosine(37)-N6)-methyltransferase TrmO [Elusimicrobia bacterium RIFOXYA12_FULL_57_11]|nr:MAG: tRNA (N6-threonylcarbamoyladenosine(37)-N6)-methyltransferase TrmO [Elusimicrobia bacterium RIFOXYA12_FULL_57_11]